MHVYTVHLQRLASEPDRNAVVIREGFSWPCFFLGPLWVLANRLWFPALGVLATYSLLLLGIGITGLDALTSAALVFGEATIIGFCANDWRRSALALRGWQYAGLAAAADRDTALRRFFDLHPEVLHPPQSAPTY